MMPAVGEWRYAAIAQTAAPSVAPTSGMRSAKATHNAKTTGLGTPSATRQMNAAAPAMALMMKLPIT